MLSNVAWMIGSLDLLPHQNLQKMHGKPFRKYLRDQDTKIQRKKETIEPRKGFDLSSQAMKIKKGSVDIELLLLLL